VSDFKIASAFVEVRAEDNTGPGLKDAEQSVKRWSRDSSNVIEVDFAKAGEKAGEKLSENISRTFERNSKGQFKSAAERAGDTLSDGVSRGFEKQSKSRFAKIGDAVGISFFTGMVKDASKWMGRTFDDLPGIAKTAGITAGIIVAAAAAPLVGAAIGGALLAAAAGPFLGLGITQALNDDSVAAAREELGDKMSATLRQAGAEFVPVVRQSIHTLSAAWDDLAPQIREGFRAAIPYVSQLTDGVVALARNAMPGLISAAKSAGPVFASLKEGLGTIGTSVGNMFGDLSQHSRQAGAAVEVTMHLIAGAIEFVGATLAGLLDGFESMTNSGASAMHWAQEWLGWLPLVGDQFGKNAKILDHLNKEMAGEESTAYGRKLKKAGDAAGETAGKTDKLKERTNLLGESMSKAAADAGSLSEAINKVNEAAIKGEEAELRYQAAIDKAAESQKEHGRTLNADTEAGRANRQSLLDLAKATNDRAAAVYNSTLQSKGQAAAEEAAHQAAEQGRQALIRQGMQYGQTRAEAERYAWSVTQIPGEKKTIVDINTIGAKDKIEVLKDSLAGLNSKTITIKVKADIPAGLSMGYLMRADGGVVERYASGGIRSEQHDAQMARAGAWRVWAEPETGGESYIPHAPSKRARSVEVLRKTNEILGSPMQERGAGGAVAVASGGGTYFQFGPGSIVLDASRIKSVQDLLALFATIQTTARQFGGGRPAAWGGAL
jgi:hypothetical protein